MKKTRNPHVRHGFPRPSDISKTGHCLNGEGCAQVLPAERECVCASAAFLRSAFFFFAISIPVGYVRRPLSHLDTCFWPLCWSFWARIQQKRGTRRPGVGSHSILSRLSLSLALPGIVGMDHSHRII